MEREKVGALLITLGVLAWPIGLKVLKWQGVNVLAVHLSLVLPGVYLRGSKILKKIKLR